ncbi:uncharacterized protein LOC134467393 [Engraulis encrasicolus]|uniref:uncharacterized protein LOC134467393 n=1 Tax=Engraulis encrasicolus TaxID=184585 RepID=UPI002FD59F38
MEPANPMNVWMWESPLCDLWRRGVVSPLNPEPVPHLSDSEVLNPMEKTEQISQASSLTHTSGPDSHTWCVRHRWRWLLQEKRAGVHLQTQQHGSAIPKSLLQAAIPTPWYALSGYTIEDENTGPLASSPLPCCRIPGYTMADQNICPLGPLASNPTPCCRLSWHATGARDHQSMGPLSSAPTACYWLSRYTSAGHTSTREETFISPCVTSLPLKNAIAEATRLSCLKPEVHKNLHSPANMVEFSSILFQAARQSRETFGGWDEHGSGLISCLKRTRGPFPVVFVQVQPVVPPACSTKSTQRCSRLAPCCHCIYNPTSCSSHCGIFPRPRTLECRTAKSNLMYNYTSCTNHFGTLNRPRTLACSTAESNFMFCSEEITCQDYGHNDIFFRTTVNDPCHAKTMVTSPCLALFPDFVTLSCEAFLPMLPILFPPEDTNSSCCTAGVSRSDPSLTAGEELDADSFDDPTIRRLRNIHHYKNSCNVVEAEGSDIDDVIDIDSDVSDMSPSRNIHHDNSSHDVLDAEGSDIDDVIDSDVSDTSSTHNIHHDNSSHDVVEAEGSDIDGVIDADASATLSNQSIQQYNSSSDVVETERSDVNDDVFDSGASSTLSNYHYNSSRDTMETERPDVNDVMDSDASPDTSSTRRKLVVSVDGTESAIERTRRWSASACLRTPQEEEPHLHLHSTASSCSDGQSRRPLKKSVSFCEEVTVFLFDKETPTHGLGPPCSPVENGVPRPTSGHADSFSPEAENIHDVEDELEWEDDFSAAALSSSLPVLRKADPFPQWDTSDGPAYLQPGRSDSLRHVDLIKCSPYSITHITDSDLE